MGMTAREAAPYADPVALPSRGVGRRQMDNAHGWSGRHPDVWKGVVSGLVGGLVASWVMNQFQSGLSKLAQDGNGEAAQAHPDERDSGDDATQKAASSVTAAVLDRSLTKSEKQLAGPIVHYAFGSAMGALYGAAAEIAPPAASGLGLPFGTALWLGADEVAVPLLGLSQPPTDYPATVHASALASHLVYGLTTDLVRRAVRRVL